MISDCPGRSLTPMALYGDGQWRLQIRGSRLVRVEGPAQGVSPFLRSSNPSSARTGTVRVNSSNQASQQSF